MIRIGVTGTDTGVGKTVVSCAIAAGMRRAGLRVAAMKPVETGVAADDPNRDGARLARAAGGLLPLSVVAPLVFPDPVAPSEAARRAGSTIDLAILDHAVRAASLQSDALIVEGAGGLLVPVADRMAFDTLFTRWSLELIVVAANRLGVINHTRLTLAAARSAGLLARAVVLNNVLPTGDQSTADNARIIAQLEDISVVELPWLSDVDDLDAASDLILAHVFPELERSGRSGARR
jgi:dethiobiotin synthetase